MSRRLIVILICLLNVACATTGNNSPDYLKRSGSSPADVYVQLGLGYMHIGSDAVALDNLKKAIKVDSRSSSAHSVIAVLYEKLGEKALAEEHYKKALRYEPGNAGAHNNYGRFLCAKGEYSEAVSQFEVAYKNPLNNKRWLALSNAGQCELQNNHLDRAETLFGKALEINPRSANTLLNMAKIRFSKNNFLSVRAYLQRYRNISLHTSETLWLGIQSEHELGQEDAVASYVITLHSKFPDSKEMRMLEEKFPQYR